MNKLKALGTLLGNAQAGNPSATLTRHPGDSGEVYLTRCMHHILKRGRIDPNDTAGWGFHVTWIAPEQAADYCAASSSWAANAGCRNHSLVAVDLTDRIADPRHSKVIDLAFAVNMPDAGGRFQPDCTDARGAMRVHPFRHAALLHVCRQPLGCDVVTIYWASMLWARTFERGRPYLYAHPIWLAHVHPHGCADQLVWQWAERPSIETYLAARAYAVCLIADSTLGD